MQKGTNHSPAARAQIAASQRERLRRLRFAEAAFEARLLLYADDLNRDECLRLAHRAHELAPDKHHAANWQRWISALESGRRIKVSIHPVQVSLFDADPALVAAVEEIFQ